MSPPPLRVLYIDDDPALGRLVQRHLGRAGHAVVLAPDGDAGLALARAERFDAVVLDHYMPGRDGLEVLRDLRALPDGAPVVFVTAAEEPRIAVTALKHGAADYVIKDVAGAFLDLLASALHQAVAGVRLQRERDAAEAALIASRDRLERLAEQQALLLREVNHRVANSLQLISSLIALQSRKLADGEARAVLSQAAKRVEAVSLVHRRLYTGQDVQSVAMDQYLQGLVEELRGAGGEGDGHRIELLAQPIRVETDKAVSIGLIVNELVTNALKYAYPAGGGAIRVALDRAAGVLRLVVEDDGVGYPAADAAPRGSGLGGVIVNAMARTMHAEVRLDRSHPGTRFVLSMAG